MLPRGTDFPFRVAMALQQNGGLLTLGDLGMHVPPETRPSSLAGEPRISLTRELERHCGAFVNVANGWASLRGARLP